MRFFKYSRQVKLFFWCLLIFLISLGMLLSLPSAVKLAESQVAAANDKIVDSQSLEEVKGEVIKVTSNRIEPPKFSARAVLAQDLGTGQIFYQKNIQERVPIASTTKIMTAMVAMEHFKQADELTVYPQALVGGSTMGLNLGERLSFRSLLYGMLLNSGNDAAYTIALNYPGGLEGFVSEMNKRARDLGLADTRFQNPAGFDSPNHYSSAFDLSRIAGLAAENPQLARVFGTKETYVSPLNSKELAVDRSRAHHLRNLNKLLSEEGVLGIKTGFTQEAGENLVGLVERDGVRVLTIVLNSKDRFGETKSLIDWVYQNFNREVN